MLVTIPPWLHDIRDWLEILFFLSGVIVAVAALLGLKQITLLKQDISTRNQRAAKEKAMECISRYAKFAELADAYFQDLQKAGLPSYKGPVSDFAPQSVPTEWKEKAKMRAKVMSWVPAINELDTLASPFVTGVACEDTAFPIIGRSFCANVGSFYDVISRYRTHDTQPHFSSIVQLYDIWSARLSRAELEAARKEIEAKITEAGSGKRVYPIGVDEP